jgi:hypothetical protein
MNVLHETQWPAKARAISHYADLFWRSSRDKIEDLREFNASAGSCDLRWVAEHWPQRNEFEQSMFVSIAAMLAKDVSHDADLAAEVTERFPLVLHFHLGAMSDDDLRDWCAEDVEPMMAAGDRSDRECLERQFIVWCEGLLGEMLDHITAE